VTRQLVVNADDLGLTEGVNRAAVAGHVQGIVTSVSLLAVGRAFDHAVRLLHDHPALSVGAHLAAVGEDPPLLTAAEVPTLVDRRGRFPLTYRTVVLRAVGGRLDPGDIRREFAAQLERIRAAGLPVSHLDTHQHTHLWPSIGREVADLADAAEVRWVRLPTSRSPGPVGAVVRRLSHGLARHLDARGLRHPDAYAGLDEAGHLDGPRFARAIAAVAAELRPGDVAEVNTHPGEPDDPDLDRFAWRYQWGDERRMLTDPASLEHVRCHGFALTSFAALTGDEPR
jgi:predicted glycoside hydrolase/deacetylase ChbG (UPF0249 family)